MNNPIYYGDFNWKGVLYNGTHDPIITKKLYEKVQKALDKLDGFIGDEEYMRLSKKFRGNLTDLKFSIEQLEGENDGNIDNGKRLLELAQKAASLYSAQIPTEKRKLLNYLHSNSSWANGELVPNFRKPFDMIVKTNIEYQRKKATFPEKNDLFEIWRPYRL